MERSTGNIVDAKTVEQMKGLCVPMGIKPTKAQMFRKPPRIGRNEPCGCGSGKKFKDCCYLKESPSKAVSPSEAVFGFAIWLSTLRTPVVFSARHDGAQAAMAAGIFCEANSFPAPDMDRTNGLRIPPGDVPLQVYDDEKIGASDIDIDDPATAYVEGLEGFLAMAMAMVEAALIESIEMDRPLLRKLMEAARAAHANQYAKWLTDSQTVVQPEKPVPSGEEGNKHDK